MLTRIALVVSILAVGCDSDVQLEDGGGGSGAGHAAGGSAGSPGQAGSSAQGGAGQGGIGSASGGAGQGGSTIDTSTSTGGMICDSQGPCGDCVAQACPDVWCSCTTNPECLPLFACTAACPPGDMHQPCIQDCMTAHPDGIAAAVLATDCAADPCGDSCPQATDPLTPCEECTYSTCPQVMNTCLANAECTALYQCLQACGPTQLSCQNDCYDAHPDGISDLEAVFDCSTGPCSRPCSG